MSTLTIEVPNTCNITEVKKGLEILLDESNAELLEDVLLGLHMKKNQATPSEIHSIDSLKKDYESLLS